MRPEYFENQLGAGANDGMLAEYAALSETGVVRIPAHLSYEEAATLPCAAVTVWHALFDARARSEPGSTILIQGTGGVSLFAAQFALASGMRVIATTSSAHKAERLRKLGVADVINYRELPEWQNDVLRLTNGEGVDHVIEVGGGGTLRRSLQSVRFGGTVSVIGLLSGFGHEIDPLPVLFRAARLEGIIVGSIQAFERMNRALETLAIKPIVDEVFPLENAIQALAKMQAATHFGKIVIRVD